MLLTAWGFLASGPIRGQLIYPDSSYVSFQALRGKSDKVPGTIRGMEGKILFDPQDPAQSQFEVCVDPATIETGIGLRDRHLKGGKFFDVKNFPVICFSSVNVEQQEDGYVVEGDLTIRGTTRRVTIPFSHENGVFRGNSTINRLDFGVGFKGTGMVGNPVEIDIICVTFPETTPSNP